MFSLVCSFSFAFAFMVWSVARTSWSDLFASGPPRAVTTRRAWTSTSAAWRTAFRRLSAEPLEEHQQIMLNSSTCSMSRSSMFLCSLNYMQVKFPTYHLSFSLLNPSWGIGFDWCWDLRKLCRTARTRSTSSLVRGAARPRSHRRWRRCAWRKWCSHRNLRGLQVASCCKIF